MDKTLSSSNSPPHQHLFDRFNILVFAILYGLLFCRLFPHLDARRFILFAGALGLSLPLADFVSGIVHWAADTWGTPEWPLVGPALIRPFREHHSDQLSITRHDFGETNGNNCLVSIPVLIAMFFVPHLERALVFVGYSVVLGLVFWIFLTNQFHKWSHTPQNPKVIEWLQGKNIILSPDHHELHHRTPHETHYCITNGAMNAWLDHAQFFRRAERLITHVTGLSPRDDRDESVNYPEP